MYSFALYNSEFLQSLHTGKKKCGHSFCPLDNIFMQDYLGYLIQVQSSHIVMFYVFPIYYMSCWKFLQDSVKESYNRSMLEVFALYFHEWWITFCFPYIYLLWKKNFLQHQSQNFFEFLYQLKFCSSTIEILFCR